MAIDAASASRDVAAAQREAARDYAHKRDVMDAQARRDQRVEEAKASDAARPTPADRAAALPSRAQPTGSSRMLDVLA